MPLPNFEEIAAIDFVKFYIVAKERQKQTPSKLKNTERVKQVLQEAQEFGDEYAKDSCAELI